MIKPKEKQIKELLKTDSKAQHAFNKMLSFYEVFDKLHLTTHVKLIKSIYVDCNVRYLWQLAILANVSASTCYRYRKDYVKCFFLYFD